MVERSRTKHVDNGRDWESTRYDAIVSIGGVNQRRGALDKGPKVLAMASVLSLPQATALESNWQPHLLACSLSPRIYFDASARLHEREHTRVNPTCKFLSVVRPDVTEPVVTHKLQAYKD